MVYAATALALFLGVGSGAAFTWWRMRTLLPRSVPARAAAKPLGTRADDEEIRRYNMANNAMGKLLDAERYDEAYNVARIWCNRAPDFVDAHIKLTGSFAPTTLPPISYAAQHLVALRNVAELRRLREIMMQRDELKPWQNILAEEIVAANELERIFGLVETHPGIAQETATRRVDAGVRRALKALHDADLRDLIRRERDGRTYTLYLE
jgi:hypothetical protein